MPAHTSNTVAAGGSFVLHCGPVQHASDHLFQVVTQSAKAQPQPQTPTAKKHKSQDKPAKPVTPHTPTKNWANLNKQVNPVLNLDVEPVDSAKHCPLKVSHNHSPMRASLSNALPAYHWP